MFDVRVGISLHRYSLGALLQTVVDDSIDFFSVIGGEKRLLQICDGGFPISFGL